MSVLWRTTRSTRLHPFWRSLPARTQPGRLYTTQATTRRLGFSILAGSIALATLTASTVIHLDASHVSDDEVRRDPATDILFEEKLRLPSRPQLPTCTLVGLGVRKVSFLRVKVYSVAFYADLNKPGLKIPFDASFEDQISYLLENTTCILRIVPTRTTSHTHLRDGLMRALQAREIKEMKGKGLSTTEEMARHTSLTKFKALFPNLPLQKHSSLDIILAQADSGTSKRLIVRDLGTVENDWVATELFKAYFDESNISPPLKEDARSFLTRASLKAISN